MPSRTRGHGSSLRLARQRAIVPAFTACSGARYCQTAACRRLPGMLLARQPELDDVRHRRRRSRSRRAAPRRRRLSWCGAGARPRSLETMLKESSTRVETMLSELSSALDQAQARDRPLAPARRDRLHDRPRRGARADARGGRRRCSASTLRWSCSTSTNGSGPSSRPSGSRTRGGGAAAGPGISPTGSRTRAAVVTYLYPRRRGPAEPIRGSVAVPMRGTMDRC